MSKHCEACNRSYPDDFDACPRCGAVAEAADVAEADVVDLGADALEVVEEEAPAVLPGAAPVAASADEPDSAVDLGLPVVSVDPNGSGSRSGQGSGLSVVEWASLVEEGPAPVEPAAASFDDPADVDLIGPASSVKGEAPAAPAVPPPPSAAEPTVALPPADDSEDALASDLEAVRTIFAGDASASFARPGPAQPAAPEPPADADDSALDLLAPPPAEPRPVASGSDSFINLGADLQEAGSGSQQVNEPGTPGQPPLPVIAGSDADIDLGGPVEAESTSHVDMGPEVLESVDSGVDLASAELEAEVVAEAVGGPFPPPLPEDEAVSITQSPEAAPPDSGVDLSGVEVVEEASGVLFVDSGAGLPGPEVVDVAPPAGPAEEAVVRPISDSGIDLSGVDPTGSDSGPQAGIEKDTPGTSDSGIDRIAEEVESGMNLHPEAFDVIGDSKVGTGADKVDEIIVGESGTALTAGQLPSGEDEVDLNEMTADAVDSSAVDLGASSANFPVAPPEPAGPSDVDGTRPYEPQTKSIHGEEEISPSEVDLGARHGGDSGKDFFEPSEAMSEAPSGAAFDDEESADLPAMGEESAVEVEDEPGPAAVEDEEAAVSVQEPPAKREKRRSTVGAWVGGAFLGGVVTAGVLVGLWLFNGGNANKAPANGTNPQGQAAPPLTFADKADLIRSGDLDRAAKAGVETADESKPDQVAARGEFRVRNYLRSQGGKAPKADDPDMQKGMKDLENAANAANAPSDDALFWLGVAKEAAGDPAGAKAEYQKGLERTKDPTMKQRFQAGLDRLSSEEGPKPAGTGRAGPILDPALFALVVTGLAPEPAQPPAPPADQPATEEAGSAYWAATKLAREGNFGEALKALDKAIDLHTKRRYTVLGKAQNPNSDPTEEIFIRSCRELKTYYAMREALQNSKLPVVKGVDPAADVAELAKEDAKRAADLAQAATDAKALGDKLTKADADLTEAKNKLQTTTAARDEAQKKLTDSDKALATTKEALTASEKKADGLQAELNTAKETVAKKTETIKGVADALTAAKALKPGDDEAAVVPAVKEVLQSKDLQGTTKIIRTLKDERDALKDERNGLQSALKERWRPEQMLSFWLPLLRDRVRPDLADKAIADADRVLKDDKASPQDKAHAQAVKGVALRDQDKFGEAKAALARAKEVLSKDDGEWVLETDTALKEASDPSAYYTAKAEDYRKEGRDAQALAMLDRALESAAPAARAALLIERGTVRLDAALARGQTAEDDADLAAARKDAEEAKKADAAGAFYLAGRIAEARGKPGVAAGDYRLAQLAHDATDAEGCRYKAALARVLMLKPHDGLGQADAATTEALKLAGDILSARGDVPFEARAEALAVQGLWTEALNTYVDGIRPHISPERAAVLTAIVEGHPALKRPTLLTVADPLEAAKHYAAGLQWWNDHEYGKAEREFFTAVEHDGLDARYYYYLGLSRLMRGDRDAFEDFEQGARLERENRPARAAVSAALERVQGEPRERLNAIRDRPQ